MKTAPISPPLDPDLVDELRAATDRTMAARPQMLSERGDHMCRRMMQRVIRITREAYDRTGLRRESSHIVAQVRAAYVRIHRLNPEVADDEPKAWLLQVTNDLLAEIGRDPIRTEDLWPR